VLRIQVPRAVADVLRRQEHLADRDPMAPERRLVLPHQRRLADGGRRLLLGNRARPLDQSEPRHARHDRAGGHEHDPPPLADRRDVGGERGDALGTGAYAGGGHEPAAHLHHEPPHASEPARGGHRVLAPRRGPGAGGAAGAEASAAESDASRAATARTSSVSPLPVTAEMTKSGRPFAAQRCSTRSRFGAASGKSALLATTICGRAASSAEYAASSPSITRRSSSGSREVIGSRSSMCRSRRVRSVWRRNWGPSPLPSAAPGMSPGRSAVTNVWSSSARTMPSVGSSVVKG